MITIMNFCDDFYAQYEREKRPIVVYGAGKHYEKLRCVLPEIHMVCDVNYDDIKERDGVTIESPHKLCEFDEKIYIIVTVGIKNNFDEICKELGTITKSAYVFDFLNNIAFANDIWRTRNSYAEVTRRQLKINIVCQEEAWIFAKFAKRLSEYLSDKVDLSVSRDVDPSADINHHIPYAAYCPNRNDTLMITHVDSMKKVVLLKKQLEVAGMGICMSRDTLEQLKGYGVPRQKLCFINPAQDGIIRPKKYVIGITHKCHDASDVRKRSSEILDVLVGVNPELFAFKIMGDGWNGIVAQLKERHFEVEYDELFEMNKYIALMQSIDYFLYMGFDEGTMGFLDALAAGVGVIVTPQGYHLDVNCAIDYPCRTVEQFRNAFLDLEKKRMVRVQAMNTWNWQNYAHKHLEIWQLLTRQRSLPELFENQGIYEDGIYSVMLEDNRV